MNRLFLSVFLCIPLFSSAQYTIRGGMQSDKSHIAFDTVPTNGSDTISFLLSNLGWTQYKPGAEYNISFSDSAFSANISKGYHSNSPGRIVVRFSPTQNVDYKAVLFISSAYYGTYSINLSGTGKHPGSYYNATQGLYGNALKSALKSITGANYVSLGYNAARDAMFMSIDNKKYNGEGASVNTLECIYTGRIISGYLSRSDAQNSTYNFNTEHTWPQSQFGQAEPMRSDLHHLFPTDNPANSQRSDYPFGAVSAPSWSQGGSKGITGLFEPRDKQKGATARAMFYFALRYQNYDSFLNQQESILRNWSKNFPPGRIDSIRNEAIYQVQKNRNPFVDHPNFLDRMIYISKADPSVVKADNSFLKGIAFEMWQLHLLLPDEKMRVHLSWYNGDSVTRRIDSVRLTRFNNFIATGQDDEATVIIPDSAVDAGFAGNISIDLAQGSWGAQQPDTIYVYAGKSLYRVPFSYQLFFESINEKSGTPVSIYPNPCTDKFIVKMPEGQVIQGLTLYNSIGQIVLCNDLISSPDEINIVHLPRGLYFVTIKTAAGKVYSEKIFKL